MKKYLEFFIEGFIAGLDMLIVFSVVIILLVMWLRRGL